MTNFPSALLPTYATYPFAIARGAGDRVYDEAGQAYLDFYGGHCVCSTGHAHPRVTEAIAAQARELLFYSNVAPLAVRDRAARALVDFAPAGITSAFFCNSGAEANENALKVAIQLTGRKRLVSFTGAFHGRTLLALSATDAAKLRAPFEGLLVPTRFLPFGGEEALDPAHLRDAAAVIVEPVQSMAGVRTADTSWFQALRAACDAAGTLLVFDEVQTGMGRLGAPFAADLYSTQPDMITMAKGLASGVPMGAVLMTAGVASRLGQGDLGTTFGGGPLACAALLATLEVIREQRLVERAAAVESRLRHGLAESPVRAMHGAGLLLGLRVEGEAIKLVRYLRERRHILIGGSDDPQVARLMPPLTIGDDAVEALVEAVRAWPGA